ncbi:Cell division protein FtsA [bacterium HR34]|nr:Cell division protein FtsA [bacterium HR34]
MDKNAIIGLDIGSSKVKLVALIKDEKLPESNLQVVHKSSGISVGVRKGRIEDPEKIFDVVSSLFDELSQTDGIEARKVFVNINGASLESIVSKANVVVSKADQVIGQEDVDRALTSAKTISLPLNKEVLGVYNNEFIIDGAYVVKNPIGLKGTRLEVRSLLITAFSPALNNLRDVMNRLDVDYEIVPTPLASSYAVLKPEQKELGVCLVDIGAGTIGIVVFYEGDLVFLKTYPFGSSNITKDIAVKLQLDFDTAEYIKTEIASCLIGQSSNKKEKIKLEDGEEISFSRKDLYHALQARVDQILKTILNDLNSLELPDRLAGGVVFTGGGSNLNKFIEYSRKFLKLPVKKANLKEQFQIPIENEQEYSCALGLALMGHSEESAKHENFSLNVKPGKFLSKIKNIIKPFLP